MSTRKILGLLLVVSGAIGMARHTDAQVREPQRPEVRGVLKSVDAASNSITVSFGEGREPATEKSYPLAGHVEVLIGSGVRGGFLPLFVEGKLADLASGVRVTLTLTDDQEKVQAVLAEGPFVRGYLKAVDSAKNTLTIALQAQRDQAGEETTYALAPDAEVAVDDGRGRRFSVREAQLGELVPGAMLAVQLSVDMKQIQFVQAEGPLLSGTIKTIDAANKTMTLTLPVRAARGEAPVGDLGEERILAIANDAVVVIDDGKGRRLSLKKAKLGDLPTGAVATVRLSVDQTAVKLIRGEGPTLTGLLKAVDPQKGTVVMAFPRGRGEAPEEQSLALAKDARIVMDGNDVKLSELPVGESGRIVQTRLSLDRSVVQSIVALQPGSR